MIMGGVALPIERDEIETVMPQTTSYIGLLNIACERDVSLIMIANKHQGAHYYVTIDCILYDYKSLDIRNNNVLTLMKESKR